MRSRRIQAKLRRFGEGVKRSGTRSVGDEISSKLFGKTLSANGLINTNIWPALVKRRGKLMDY